MCSDAGNDRVSQAAPRSSGAGSTRSVIQPVRASPEILTEKDPPMAERRLILDLDRGRQQALRSGSAAIGHGELAQAPGAARRRKQPLAAPGFRRPPPERCCSALTPNRRRRRR